MIKKKVCMLGTFAVGKTSLVKRFVESIFSEKYLTTVGVKIDKKTINFGSEEVNLLLWDIQGEDEFQSLQLSYLRGAAGYLLVIDGTRATTLEGAVEIQRKVEESIGEVPFIAALNKSDLTEEWELEESALTQLEEKGWKLIKTSAKSGLNVEDIFMELTGKLVEK
jgi:small GTP-binding protein